jgi:hypothetical protein
MSFHNDLQCWECDGCGNRVSLRFEFFEDWTALKAEGWQAARTSNGEWRHRCPGCATDAKAILDRLVGRRAS